MPAFGGAAAGHEVETNKRSTEEVASGVTAVILIVVVAVFTCGSLWLGIFAIPSFFAFFRASVVAVSSIREVGACGGCACVWLACCVCVLAPNKPARPSCICQPSTREEGRPPPPSLTSGFIIVLLCQEEREKEIVARKAGRLGLRASSPLDDGARGERTVGEKDATSSASKRPLLLRQGCLFFA